MKLILITFLLIPFMSALIGFFIGKKNENLRNIFYDCITFLEFLISLYLFKESLYSDLLFYIPDIMGVGLNLKIDSFRILFIVLTTFVWFLSTIYSTQYLIKYKNRNRYYTFFMMTLGATLGIFMSENIINLFTLFEIMAFTSYILVIHDEDKYSHDAGKMYILISVAGGMVSLLGIFLLYDYTNALDFTLIRENINLLGKEKYIIGFLLMSTFAIKACSFPFHIWLPKVYPAAPMPVTAVLSAVLSKAGVFGLIMISYYIMPSDSIYAYTLMVMSLITMFLGGFLALFQRNVKRILAYSSMSQLGYITLGVSIFTFMKESSSLALLSTLYHIINHGIFKVLLFFTIGIIYMFVDDLSINKIRGFFRHKNLIKLFFVIGMFAVCGFPGFNGFISKNLIHHAFLEIIHENHIKYGFLLNLIFNISSSFTVAYMLKIFISLFVESNNEFKGQFKNKIKKRGIFSLAIPSILIIYLGLFANDFVKYLNLSLNVFDLEHVSHLEFYSLTNIKSSLSVFALGILIYFLFIRRHLRILKNGVNIYINPSLKWMNLEQNFYIPLFSNTYKSFVKIFSLVDRSFINLFTYLKNSFLEFINIDVSNKNMNDKDINNIKDLCTHLRVKGNSLSSSIMLTATLLVIMILFKMVI
ncbi:MAG: proton-conducting transporter membrane subunit [Peptostreptococcaceae bacterium]|nr:proton-conducting transporter membrane subunit [Peptostreptococcaceae bacterium]